MKDSLVSGTGVSGAGVLANGGWLGARLGPCRLVTFRLFISTSITVGGGPADAYDCAGDGSLGAASVNSVGGGTIVGWLVSMMMRSGGC
jgi:hypothetical protein